MPVPQASGHGSVSSGRLAALRIAPHNNFDLVRLAAATQVVVYHTTLLLGLALWPPFKYVLDALPGVPIFFVTSGFLLTGSLERDPDLRRFAINRILRIYPALWVCFGVTLVLLALSGVLHQGLLLSRRGALWVLAQLTLATTTPGEIRRFGLHEAPNGALWTISVEIGFYVFLAVLWWALVGRVPRRTADAVLVAVAVGSFLVFVYSNHISSAAELKALRSTPFPYLWIFLFGVLSRRWWRVVGTLVRGRAVLWIPLAVVGYHVLPAVAPRGVGWLGYALETGLLGLAALSAAFTLPGLADRILRGVDLSYGIYLYHYLWISTFVQIGLARTWAVGLLVFACTGAAACISWFAIESPALRHKAKAPAGLSGAAV